MRLYILAVGAVSAALSFGVASADPFAVVDQSGTVTNVIEGDASDAGFLSAFPNAVPLNAPGGVGSHYNSASQTFDAPPPPAAPAEQWISRTDFLRRLTTQERIAIRGSTDPVIVDFYDLLQASPEINLKDPLTSQGLDYLTSAGLLASGRAAQILQ